MLLRCTAMGRVPDPAAGFMEAAGANDMAEIDRSRDAGNGILAVVGLFGMLGEADGKPVRGVRRACKCTEYLSTVDQLEA